MRCINISKRCINIFQEEVKCLMTLTFFAYFHYFQVCKTIPEDAKIPNALLFPSRKQPVSVKRIKIE